MSNRIPSYTVVEMLVVMIISVIIVSLSYQVFRRSVFFAQYISSIYEKNYDFVLYNRLLMQDYLLSEAVVKTSNGFTCRYKESDNEYFFAQELVRRQKELSDTLKGVTQVSMEYQYLDSQHVYIKECVLKGTYNGEEIRCRYVKEYASDFIMRVNGEGN